MIGCRVAALACVAALLLSGCASDGGGDDAAAERRVDEQLTPNAAAPAREGLAAAILIDVSGSMATEVQDADGQRKAKIDTARRAASDLVAQFARYAADHPEEAVELGLYEFSQRPGESDCRPIVAMGPPDRARAEAALAKVRADGDTPIGNAMITAKQVLDGTGLSRRHLLVVTDGENTSGVDPQRVTVAIGRRPDAERPSIYFVAFDIETARFSAVRDAGALVLGAANAKELNDTLDALLRGKILVEQ